MGMSVFEDPYATPVSMVIEWRLPLWAALRFEELLGQLEQFQEDPDTVEALKDQIRSLPGYPRDTNPDTDIIYLVVTDRRH